MLAIAIFYFALSLLYYIQRTCVFIRKNEIAVFNRRIQNVSASASGIYFLKNTKIKQKRQNEKNDIDFSLFAVREVDEHKLQFLLKIYANVDFLDAAMQMKDPLEQSIHEITSAVHNCLSDCETITSYLLFGNETNVAWKEFNKRFAHTRINHMKICIDDVQVITKTEPNSVEDTQFHDHPNLENDASSTTNDNI